MLKQTTHDYLFKEYVRQNYGNNFLTSIKYLSTFVALLFLIVITLNNSYYQTYSSGSDAEPQIIYKPTTTKVRIV